MPLQRRYSVTGQTPPDHAAAMKPHSPKLQALDTSVQTTSCGLCEGGGADSGKSSAACDAVMGGVDASDDDDDDSRGRKMAHHPTARTSSKRSATQLPSPNTPSSHELPPKIARRGRDHDAMDIDDGCLTDPFPEESDWTASSDDSFSASSPASAPSSAPDEPLIEPLSLSTRDDMGVEALALSPPPSSPPPTTTAARLPATLLTLPPELRHQIYRQLPDLVLPYPLIYCLSTFAHNMQHPLASVSRLVRAEALAIFYSYNTWTIKLEFRLMYEAFHDWIIRLGDGARLLRLVTIAVRGRLFKPRTTHASVSSATNAAATQPGSVPAVEEYHPPDGDASFRIDLSEKFPGGRVELVRNEGTPLAGEQARTHLAGMVARLWERRRAGVLNGQDWVDMVDDFLAFTGWW